MVQLKYIIFVCRGIMKLWIAVKNVWSPSKTEEVVRDAALKWVMGKCFFCESGCSACFPLLILDSRESQMEEKEK